MSPLRWLFLIGILSAGAAWAQDENSDASDPDTAAAEAQQPAAAEAEEPAKDDSDLDEQTYDNDQDDFRPSEDIPADQSIAFPTDI